MTALSGRTILQVGVGAAVAVPMTVLAGRVAGTDPLSGAAPAATAVDAAGADDVLYRININNSGDARADIVYEFRFEPDDPQPEHVPVQHRSRSTRWAARISTGHRR